MCRDCRWLELTAAIMANVETRDRRSHTTHLLHQAAAMILVAEHVTDEQRDAIETIAEKEGWAVA